MNVEKANNASDRELDPLLIQMIPLFVDDDNQIFYL